MIPLLLQAGPAIDPDAIGAEKADSFGSIPLFVLGGYLLFLLLLGVFGYLRSQSSEEDYYLAGRKQGWIVSSLTIMATFFSSWALLGAPGKVYTDGIVFALFALNVPLSGACIYLFGRGISRLGKRMGYVTPGDMIADYYGSDTVRILTAITCVLYVVPYVVMQIQAGGLLVDSLLGAPLIDGVSNFAFGSVLLAAVTTLYIMIGGMRSVAWTDVFQGLLLVAGMLLGGYVIIEIFGGVSEFSREVAKLPEAWLTAPGATGTWAPMFLFSVCVFGACGTMVSPAQWMRYYSADGTKSLKRSALIFAIVLTACFFFGVMLVGIGGRILYPCPVENGAPVFEAGQLVINQQLDRADQILIVVLREQLPQIWPVAGMWLASIMVMAIAAGSMSTADSNLHALSAVLTRDVYDRFIRPNASARERMNVGRWTILFATLVALLLVLGGENDKEGALGRSMQMIVDIGVLAISFSAQLLPIAIDILWLRRGSARGAAFGLAAGLVTTVLIKLDRSLVDGFAIGPLDIKMMEGAWGLLVNGVVFALISWRGKPPVKAALFHRVLSERQSSDG